MTGPLCVCGIDTFIVALAVVLLAIMYGELVARDAVRRSLPDHARHCASDLVAPKSSNLRAASEPRSEGEPP